MTDLPWPISLSKVIISIVDESVNSPVLTASMLILFNLSVNVSMYVRGELLPSRIMIFIKGEELNLQYWIVLYIVSRKITES